MCNVFSCIILMENGFLSGSILLIFSMEGADFFDYILHTVTQATRAIHCAIRSTFTVSDHLNYHD